MNGYRIAIVDRLAGPEEPAEILALSTPVDLVTGLEYARQRTAVAPNGRVWPIRLVPRTYGIEQRATRFGQEGKVFGFGLGYTPKLAPSQPKVTP